MSDEKFSVRIVWGEAREPDDAPKEYTFATKAELDAFLLGIEEGDGWMAHEVYVGEFLYVGTKVIWTDPDGEDKIAGEVVGYLGDQVFAVMSDGDGEIEAPISELTVVS